MFDIKLTNLIFKEKLHIKQDFFFHTFYNIILLNMYLYKKKK
jgi:hypothetical protein